MVKQSKNNKHVVPNLRTRIRIVDYCGSVFPQLGSKSSTKKAITAGYLWLNGNKATTAHWLKHGDIIELVGSSGKKTKTYEIDLPIIYEDDYLIIVNKPGGIAVNGNRFKTVENALANIRIQDLQPDALARPIAVHRLDVPTAGLVMLAKTKSAQIQLNRAFQEKRVQKEYFAIVHGRPSEHGDLNDPIDGKKSSTGFERIRAVRSRIFEHLSLLLLIPHTGRTHQLRIHLKNSGHLIVGDKMYAAGQKTIHGKGMLLCATKLRFDHPITRKKMQVEIELPAKFKRILDREEARFE